MFSFSIPQWNAWAPGVETREKWRQWTVNPYCSITDTHLPDVGFLPPLQRRRLSPLARASIGCAWPLVDGLAPMPIVYASHHGETGRSFELLRTLAKNESLSPTAFSLSVHNAIAGLWSILRSETCESVALSAEGDGLEAAIAEACLLLQAGNGRVLVILAEILPPSTYVPWIQDVPFTYVVALRVEHGADFSLSLEPSGDASEESQAWPSPLSLVRHLTQGTTDWCHAHARRCWRWRHTPAATIA